MLAFSLFSRLIRQMRISALSSFSRASRIGIVTNCAATSDASIASAILGYASKLVACLYRYSWRCLTERWGNHHAQTHALNGVDTGTGRPTRSDQTVHVL